MQVELENSCLNQDACENLARGTFVYDTNAIVFFFFFLAGLRGLCSHVLLLTNMMAMKVVMFLMLSQIRWRTRHG
jgi:hypothetical protein